MASANQGLLNRITSLFRSAKADTGKQPATGPLGTTESFSKYDRLAQRFKVDQDRLSILKDVNEMYHNDDRCKAIIDSAAEDSTYGGFNISVSDAAGEDIEEVKGLLNGTRKLFRPLPAWVKKALIEGDMFLQAVVVGDEITELIRMPGATMRRNSNELDKFEDPLRAFAQVDPLTGAAYALDINLAQADSWFAEWQIIHARWNHLGGRYGNSLLRSSRPSYKKTREGETDMAIRRKTRAGVKYVHELEDANDAEIEAYKNRNKDVLNNPFAAIADFFTNKKTKVTAIQGDAKLNDIDDVKHHIDTMFVSSPIPKSLLGYGQDINRDVLEKQEAQYLRKLEMISDWIDEHIIKPVIELQLLLKGILPESVRYEIRWPDRSTDTFMEVVDGAVKLASLGLPKHVWLSVLRKVITDMDVDATLKEMDSEDQSSQAKETAAIAQSLELMRGQMAGGGPDIRKGSQRSVAAVPR